MVGGVSIMVATGSTALAISLAMATILAREEPW